MIDEFENRIEAIRTWKGPEPLGISNTYRELEVVDFTSYILESFELITDLHTEVKKLREVIDTSLEYIKRPDIDDDSHTLSVVKKILEGDEE